MVDSNLHTLSGPGKLIKTGYLGPRGTFTEEALMKYRDLPEAYKKEYKSIPEVIKAIGREVQEGIVPVENSLEGSVNITLDILAEETDLEIKNEIIIPIRHHLLAGEKVELSRIRVVYSHPQAIAQCRIFREKYLPWAEIEAAFSTAQAASIVSHKREVGCVAIGNRKAAELYGLLVLRENIQDYHCNYTRFIVLAPRGKSSPSGRDKTSLVFGIKDGPGALYQVLREFARRELNLTRIESRPSKRNLGDYLFFVDLQGHIREEAVAEVVQAVKKQTVFLKVLGSYPEAPLPQNRNKNNR